MTRKLQFLLGIAFALLGAAALVVALWLPSVGWWVHGVWCVFGLALVIPILYRALQEGFLPFLRNHFLVFIGAFAAYNLIGALLPVIGPEAAASYALAYYDISAADALRVDAANGIGFGVALLTGAISYGRLFSIATRRLTRLTSSLSSRDVATLFLIMGVPATAYVLSVDLGLREGPVAGIWRSVSKLSLVAVFLATAHRGPGEKSMLIVGVVTALAESVAGFLLLSKMSILLPLLVMLAGLSVRLRNRLLLPLGVAAVLLIFGPLGGIVAFGRNTLGDRLDPATAVAMRSAVVNEALSLAAAGSYATEYHPWARFYYTSAQTAAMDFYERGDGGRAFALVPWLFVPRAIAPMKPIITQGAKDFHTKISGYEGSSTGQGIFISGYYSGGWIGLIAVAILCGWILAQTSAIAGVVLHRGDALLLPLALYGVYVAFKVNGHFLWSYLGPFVLVAYVILVGAVASNVSRTRRSIA